jgi:RNA polymerase sigma factor (sigma-70 family)
MKRSKLKDRKVLGRQGAIRLGMWEALFEEAYPFARRAAEVRSRKTRLADDSVDRDDLKQEVLMEVWAALRNFDPGRASLGTFIERIAAHEVVSFKRRIKAKKRTKPADFEFVSTSKNMVITVQLRVDLGRLLRNLAPLDRCVARLLVEDSPAQVARILGISRSAVYRSIERIRDALLQGGYR